MRRVHDTSTMPVERPRDLIVKLLAIGVALVGLGSMISALTPSLAERQILLDGVIPVMATRSAQILVFELGFLLVLVAFGLVRRRHRAWQLALLLLALSAVLHVVKGLDIEEALVCTALLIALIARRSAFTVAGGSRAPHRAMKSLGVLVVIGLIVGIALTEFFARRAGDPVSLTVATDQALEAFVGAPYSLSALGVYTAIAIAITALIWLRPVANPPPSSRSERTLARQIMQRYATDGLAYFALRDDSTLMIARTHDAVLAYRVEAGVAIVSGDVIGSPLGRAILLRTFHEEQIAAGRRIAAVGLPESSRALWEQAGLMTTYIGDEAVVDPQAFSLDGRTMRKVRQSVHRIEREGFTIEIVRRRDADEALLKRLRSVSDQWLGGRGERGFSMSLDNPWLVEHGDGVFAVAHAEDGSLVGYIHYVPVMATNDLSLSTMRRVDDAPNGLNEALLAATFAWAKAQGMHRISLNFSAFGRILRSDDLTGWQRIATQTLLQGDRWFQLERLDAFNRKFLPTWEPHYAAYERRVDLPQAALAILAAERLIRLPRMRQRGASAAPHVPTAA